jgi:hypothetical protein
MRKVVPGPDPGKKTLVSGPRQEFVFDWSRVGTGSGSKLFLTETVPEPKMFFDRDRDRDLDRIFLAESQTTLCD